MSKYSFALAHEIRSTVEWKLEHYHEDKKQLEQYKRDMIPSTTQSYSQTGGVTKGSTSNPTESITVRMASSAYILETERTIQAIDRVLAICDSTDSQLIDLVYWQRSYSIEGASLKVGLTKTPAYNRINNILCQIALELGYVSV
jgi:RinA family phage transcriptional activator